MAEANAARLARLRPDTLDPARRAVYDAITGGPRAQGPRLFALVDDEGGLEGPFNAFLLSPRIGDALQALGAAVRFGTTLPDRAREVAVLVVARQTGSDFEWYAHEAVGRHAGLTDADLDAIRTGRPEALGDATERLVAETAVQLLTSGDLDDDGYAAAVRGLGEVGLFELLALVGYYTALAVQLRVFRVGLPVNGSQR